MELALEVRGATKRYARFTLDDVSLRVPRGGIVGLIGENGAGKTTTLKIILGLIRAEAGEVSLLGQTDPEAMRRIKSRVGVVLDEGFFHDLFRPGEVQRVCARIYPNWRPDVFDGWLRRLNLPGDKKIREYSKGMKMKLAIAVALSHEAELLILDEATGGLDPVVRSEILDLFLDFIQDERRAVLFSTHITADLARVADEIAFLHGGRLAFQRSKDELLAAYGVLKCGQAAYAALDAADFVGSRRGAYGMEVLLRDRGAYLRRHPDAVIDPATLDDVMLFTIRGVAK